MTTRTITVVSAGLGQPSSTRLLADRLANATATALGSHDLHDVTIEAVELRDHAHDLTNNLLTFFATEPLQAAKDLVTGADGIVAVSPVYSASDSGLFKTFFDLLDRGALEDVPVLMGATGGTPRHSLVLEHAFRPLFTHLRAATVPTAVYAASQDWGVGDDDTGHLDARIRRAAEELATMMATRDPRTAADPYAITTPFEQLRAG